MIRGQAEPYQQLLRVVGAYLDEQKACAINVFELEGEFALRWQTTLHEATTYAATLDFAELSERAGEMEGRRRRALRSRLVHHEAVGRYENLLRSLGYELEQAGAFFMMADELEEGFLLTYTFLNPAQSFLAHKRMVVVGTARAAALTRVARARRGHLLDHWADEET